MPRAINTALAPELCRCSRTDNGNLDGVGHLIDDRPIGLARIELRGAATMYRHRGGPCSLKHLGKRRGVAVFGVKALTDFYGHGHMRRAHRRLDDLLGQIGSAHKRRALALGDDLASRAGHVDIDQRQAIAHTLLDGSNSARKLIGLGAKELHGQGPPRSPSRYRQDGHRDGGT